MKQYEIKDRRERRRLEEKRRLLEKAKLKGRKGKKGKGGKNAAAAANANTAAPQPQQTQPHPAGQPQLPMDPHQPLPHDVPSDDYLDDEFDEGPLMTDPVSPSAVKALNVTNKATASPMQTIKHNSSGGRGGGMADPSKGIGGEGAA